MSFTIVPFGSLFDDWHVHDPLRKELFQGMRSQDGGDLTKPMAPLLAMDVIENEKEFKVIADLPGVSAENLELTVENQSIIMKAERKHEHKTETDKVYRLERSYGTVTRKLLLPKNADMNLAQTHFANGVLTVTVPKHVELPPATRKLAINTA